MIGLFIFLGLVAAAVLVLWLIDLDERRRSALDRVRDELFVADQEIESEFHQARRAMNDAAGQSWRNLAG